MGQETEPQPGRGITGAAFWALMDRWRVADADALALIGGPRLPPSGKRPRFRLHGAQVARFAALREIDRLATDIAGDPAAWLHAPNVAAPFRRRSPLATMLATLDSVPETLHYLQVQSLRASLGIALGSAQPPAPGRKRRS